MLAKPSKTTQLNLFHSPLSEMPDMSDPLIALAHAIDWNIFDDAFEKYYAIDGRPAKPIRLMAGILLLKQLKDISDDEIVIQCKQNPYFQYFCGNLPSTCTFFLPLILCVLSGSGTRKENIQLRRTYMKEIKGHRISLRFFRHPRKRKKAQAAMKRLRTIAKTILRDLDRNFEEDRLLHDKYAERLYLYMRVLLQEKNTPDKIYSLHEPHAYAVGKGKDQEQHLMITMSMTLKHLKMR